LSLGGQHINTIDTTWLQFDRTSVTVHQVLDWFLYRGSIDVDIWVA
jgi:hypothetical protein